MKNKSALIVFAKYPEKGEVKSRLAATTNSELAYNVYELLAGNTFRIVNKLKTNFDIYLYYSNAENVEKVKNWVGFDFNFRAQMGNDLGQKMSNAFNDLFDLGYSNVLIIGTDVPEHTCDNISAADKKLSSNDIVIGKSGDGGYYLLGMNSFYHELFSGIEWSTNEVAKKTIEKTKQLNLSCGFLPQLNDIDTESDLNKWLESDTGNAELRESFKKLL